MRVRRLIGLVGLILSGAVGVAPPATAASGPWSVVSAGGYHTCAINTAKNLYCWGYNAYGQIGDGTTGSDRPTPTKIGASGAWADVSAGLYHTCAVTTGKSLYCWGYNFYGQVGDGTTTTPRPSPKKVGASGVWASVAAGGYHSCALTTGKSLYCWGYNVEGQVGDGTTTSPRPSPKKIGSSGVWAGATAGEAHTCALTTGKSLYCWGNNVEGQVGDGTTTHPRPSPKKIGASGVWALASVGDSHSCAITTGKSLYCWGKNSDGQVGDGTTTSPRPSPKKIGASGVWARINAGGTAGYGHNCAITTGNSLYCWGFNLYGQVGDGTVTTPRSSPKKIGASGVWAGARAGGSHSCALTTGKALYCWGFNEFGEIGDGTDTSPRPSPKKVA